MTPSYNDQSVILEENSDSIFRTQILTLLLIDVSGALSIFNSVLEVSRKVQSSLLFNGAVSLMILLMFLARRVVKRSRLLNRIYFIFTLVIILLIQVITMDYSIVLTMTYLSSMLIVVYLQFNIIYINITLSLYFIILLYQILQMPSFTVVLGRGFYINSFFAIFIAFVASQLGIRLFRKYESLFFEKVSTVTEQLKEIKNLNLSTLKEHERLESVFEASHDGIVDIEQATGVVNMSARSTQLLGFECHDLDTLEEELSLHFDEAKRSVFFEEWYELKKSGSKSYSQECYYFHPDERIRLKFNFLAYSSSVDDSRHLLLVIKDVTKEFEQADKIYKMAYEDSLTGLMNRLALVEYVEKYKSKFDQSCILILDIDNFRFFNDSFGYEIGDRLLKKVGKSLATSKNNYIKAVARLSSNDFALYMNTSTDGQLLFNEIQRDFSQYTLDDIEIKLNYSAGLAYFSESDQSADGLIKKAEIAMYKAKEWGKKGICVFSDNLNEEINRHMDIMNELEDAISSNEFSLNYQPKIDSASNGLIGFESLIRWKSPRLGFVPPDEFIPLAEQSGLIHLLGEFVIRESCKFIRRVRAYIGENEDFRISINVSAVQILNSGFYNSFFRILDEVGVPAYMVGLEITETAVMENMEYVCHQLEQFRAKGVRIYLDDFGTGYSSLNYLTMLPIDILKIDKTFIDNIHIERRQYQVVKMIISLAEVFSLKTIAEGVETSEQLDILKDLDCHYFQGYYFSKPLVEDDAYQYLIGNKTNNS